MLSGTTNHGFAVLRTQPLPELGAVMHHLRHERTGLELVWLERDEVNRTFGIAFPTLPEDDTGVFHILEHSVLCGSERYPVREPFVELMKTSMNTFLNAMTFPDKTYYPISSRNPKDFLNLMRVYLDAVFRPLIYSRPEIFRQEGWHYELDAEGRPGRKGVVYNEMRGAFADADELEENAIMRALYPDTPYRFVSGGDPEHIPELTYEKFLDFHRRFYSPSNAYVFLDYFSGNESGTFGAVKSATYTTRTSYWMVGATLDWTKEFGDHRINILGGWNEEVDRRNGWDDVALLSFFGKAYYSYKDKYLAEVGIRRDGSSLFGDGHKWGNFPSVAVGWNVNREPWMQNARFIDNFKIRASYGMLGNNNVALYRYQTIIDNSGNEIVNGNPDLTWEKVKILDAGVDLSLFGQKLEVTFDWFRKVTDDMIVNVPSTPSSGLLAAPMNVGKAEVKGYEIGVGFNHSFTKDIDFSINLGYSYNKSKWLEITNDELINGNTIYRKGHAIKEYYGYQADHLLTQDDLDFRVPIIGGYDGATTAQLPGDIRYVDTNGDKVITTDDRVPLGDQDPHSVYYGNLSFRWKNLDFDMQVNGVGYVPIFYQGLISNPLDPEYGGTPQRWHLDHWKAENPDRNAKLPRVTTDPGNNALLSTFWKENGAFVRIKYMQLGYNFKALAKKIHAGNFRVYVNVQNPFTFTKVELIDPETKGTHTTYPMFKTYSVGLNVNF